MELVGAQAVSEGADTLITIGGVHSNHARVTAATAVRLGMKCLLVINGSRPEHPAGNAFLHELLGADIEYVATRDERVPAMRRAAERLVAEGKRAFEIPLGASTPIGALAYARAVGEVLLQGPAPDAIVVASSSGGTLAGLLLGCRLHGLQTRVLGVSADDPATVIQSEVRRILDGVGGVLGPEGEAAARACRVEVNDSYVGEGYGIPTAESREAVELAARSDGLFLDPTYTAKAMSGLIDHVRQGSFGSDDTVLFWHTGGQVELVTR